MVQPPKKPQQAADQVASRRRSSRREREEQRQRQIVILSSIAIGVALLAVLIGVLYDRVYIPSQPVAQVNNVSLSKADYWHERRGDSASSISQALFLTSFGQQFAQQVLGQVSALDSGITTLQTEAIDDNLISTWTDRQLVIQGGRQMNISISDGEVAQLINAGFGPSFGPMITATTSITPTAEPTATTAPTQTPTLTPGGPTPTFAPTFTPVATFTPQPSQTPTVTPLPDDATTRFTTIYKNLYSRYIAELAQIDPTRKARLTEDDFKYGLFQQFLRQAYAAKIEEQLVPDANFTPSTEPTGIETRHLLIRVTVPVSATQAEQDKAFEARRADADALLKQALATPTDFEKLTREKSEDYTTKESGGSLPTFDKAGKTVQSTQMEPAIVAAVTPLKDGEIAPALVRTPFGWHIVQLIKRNIDDRTQQLQTARTKAFNDWLAKQQSAAQIKRYPAVTPTATALPTATAGTLPTAGLAGEPSPTPLATPSPIPVAGTPAATTVAPTPTTVAATAAATTVAPATATTVAATATTVVPTTQATATPKP